MNDLEGFPSLSPAVGATEGTSPIENLDQNHDRDSDPLSGNTITITSTSTSTVETVNYGTPDLFAEAAEKAAEKAVEQQIGFDPAIHAVNADGTPKMRVNGSFMLKRGRKSGGSPGTPKSAGVPVAATDDAETSGEIAPNSPEVQALPGAVQASANAVSNAQTARFLVDTVTGVLSRAIGPEWAVEKDERSGLANATKQYLDAKGGLQISPEMGLLLAVSAYAAPRFAVPNTQTKISRFVGWCADRVAVARRRLGL